MDEKSNKISINFINLFRTMSNFESILRISCEAIPGRSPWAKISHELTRFVIYVNSFDHLS